MIQTGVREFFILQTRSKPMRVSHGSSERETGRFRVLQVLASEEQWKKSRAERRPKRASQFKMGKSVRPLSPLHPLSSYPSAGGGFSVMSLSREEEKSCGRNRREREGGAFPSSVQSFSFFVFALGGKTSSELASVFFLRLATTSGGREEERRRIRFLLLSSPQGKNHDAPLHPAPGGRARRRHGRAEV